MKWKLISILSVLVLTLMACQGDNDNAEGVNDNLNIDQTTFPNGNTGDGMITDRDYMLERDADRNQNRDGGDNRMNNNGNNNQDGSRYEIAEEVADEITKKIKGIDRAYVLTTGNNAYVAANLENGDHNRTGNMNNNGEGNDNHNGNKNGNNNQAGQNNGKELTDDVKKEIEEIVKSSDDNIDNVYVSTNPDFMDLANNYANDVENGQPIEGFFNQFGNMFDRLFPENVDKGNDGEIGDNGNNGNNGNR